MERLAGRPTIRTAWAPDAGSDRRTPRDQQGAATAAEPVGFLADVVRLRVILSTCAGRLQVVTAVRVDARFMSPRRVQGATVRPLARMAGLAYRFPTILREDSSRCRSRWPVAGACRGASQRQGRKTVRLSAACASLVLDPGYLAEIRAALEGFEDLGLQEDPRLKPPLDCRPLA